MSLVESLNLIPTWKIQNPELREVHSQILQNVVKRVDFAFKAFFRRVKNSEKPGYPRFKGAGRYDSFTYPQSGFKLINNKKLKMYGIGTVGIRKHREIQGTIKTLTICKYPTGKWYACFSCDDVPDNILPESDKAVGIDLGATSTVTLSTGEKVDNPKYYQKKEKELKKVQRRLCEAPKGTQERRKINRKLCKIHEKIKNKRHDFVHKLSKELVYKFQYIIFEKIDIQNLTSNSNFSSINKSILDSSWGNLLHCMSYKAEEAGRTFIQVDPRDTSKQCSGCNRIVDKPLSTRVHRCTCGLELDRDHNAALNILALGMQSLGMEEPAIAGVIRIPRSHRF